MLLIEGDDHLDDIAEKGEGEFVVEDSESSGGLGLLDSQGLELGKGELISPPICLTVAIINSRLMPGGELGFILDVSDAGEERVMHYEKLHIFCIDNVELDEICSLV